MSLRKIWCQYIGDTLRLPDLEREVEFIRTEDGRCFVQAVHCKDCDYSFETTDGRYVCQGPLVETWDYRNDEPAQTLVEGWGFCAWGKTKEDA